jgi:hypothetical protein
MEQRWNERFLANKDVDVQFPGGRTLKGRTRNVSLRGMFVELDIANPPAHGLVQLVFSEPGSTSDVHLRIPAAISRYAREGLGLVYCGDYAPLLKHLRAWAKHAWPDKRNKRQHIKQV